MTTKRTRRKPSTTRKMPTVLTLADVEAVEVWPLGAVMTAKAAGQGWVDVLLVVDDAIRLGGRFNSRRVRYDGAFYITHNGRRVGFDAALNAEVLACASHVYGVCKESDKAHNRALKGY